MSFVGIKTKSNRRKTINLGLHNQIKNSLTTKDLCLEQKNIRVDIDGLFE